MLENIGATVAVNDLLLQSHGGRMRFFPVWNASVLGAASFTTLRAYGAFLVSGAIDAHGIVAPVSLESEVGGAVVFDSPWHDDDDHGDGTGTGTGTAHPKVIDGAGAAVPTTVVSPGVYSFASKAEGNYTISSGN
jgi:hypothetical protein